MEISKIIKELLFTYECVILPEFGGFISRNQSAQFDRINYNFTPPRKIISFNPVLVQDDGLMITEIAKRENIDYAEAKKLLQQEVNAINQDLSNNGIYLLAGLGSLRANYGVIEFTPQNNLNLDKELFGLPQFQAERIIPQTAKKENEAPFKEWQSYAAAVIFALGIGTAGIYANKSMLNSQLGSFFPVEVSNSKEISLNNAHSPELIEEKISKPLEISIPDLIEIKSAEPAEKVIKPYQVIGGSHKKYYRAMEQEAYFKRNGYPNAVIIGIVNGYTMVAYETFDDRASALELKRELEQNGKDVFLRE